ncbi:MAG: sensor histidine kinase [Gaiellaceae bacterium]
MIRLRVEPDFRAGATFLAAGIVLSGVYFAFPHGGLAQSIVYEGLGIAAALALLWGIRLHRPRHALPWILFAAGNAASVTGDLVYDLEPNAVSPAFYDVFYLAAYPLLAAALILLLVHAGGHHRLAAIAEAGIVTFAFALVQWIFLMHPALNGSGGPGARAINATYPLGDLVLLAGFAGLFVSPAWRKPSFWFLVAAVVAMVVGDEIYSFSADTYAAGDPLDVTWLLSYVLFGVGGLHPSMRDLGEPRRSARLRVSRWRIVLLTAALVTPGGLLIEQWARGAALEVPAIFSASVLISALVVWRFTGILRALERLRIRERAARADADAARERLAAQNEQLLEADRLKDEFVALISHDLRTPLTSIMGYTELALEHLVDASGDEERRGYLEVVARSSERLLRLVDDLLFVARLQAGQGLELEPTVLDVATIARQSVHEAGPRARAKGLELHFEGPDTAPLYADRGRLFQLLDNLVANAIKFTPAGGSIVVSVAAAPDGGIVLEVSDTGIGLTADDAEKLFDRFFRSSRAVAAQIPGTGLGLFIARAIAEAHGGTIGAHPRDGVGTVFRIELPARTPAKPSEKELVA